MEKVTKNTIQIFEHNSNNQNRKILRYRSCLAQLAVVCVNIKRLKPENLSVNFCYFFKNNLKPLTEMRQAVQIEIQKQSELGWISKETRPRNFYSTSHLLAGPSATEARVKIYLAIRYFCDVLLSELHVLNYEHLSNEIHENCGKIMDFYTSFRHEIAKEKELQSQPKIGRFLRKAS